jgi:hypothetical protein
VLLSTSTWSLLSSQSFVALLKLYSPTRLQRFSCYHHSSQWRCLLPAAFSAWFVIGQGAPAYWQVSHSLSSWRSWRQAERGSATKVVFWKALLYPNSICRVSPWESPSKTFKHQQTLFGVKDSRLLPHKKMAKYGRKVKSGTKKTSDTGRNRSQVRMKVSNQYSKSSTFIVCTSRKSNRGLDTWLC